jgi:hypothetical protein
VRARWTAAAGRSQLANMDVLCESAGQGTAAMAERHNNDTTQ